MKQTLKSALFTCALILSGFVSIGQSPKASATVVPIPSIGNAAADSNTAVQIIKVAGPRRAHRIQRGNRVQRGNRFRNRARNRIRFRNPNRFRNRVRNRGRVFAYRSNRHGPRFRHRRGRNRFYNNGFWYTAPFWLGAVYGNPYYYDDYYYIPPRRSYRYSRHTRWCLNRFKSYNIRTDTYRGYDGLNHRCRSPFRR